MNILEIELLEIIPELFINDSDEIIVNFEQLKSFINNRKNKKSIFDKLKKFLRR